MSGNFPRICGVSRTTTVFGLLALVLLQAVSMAQPFADKATAGQERAARAVAINAIRQKLSEEQYGHALLPIRFDDALASIAKQTSLKITVDWAAIEKVGVKRDMVLASRLDIGSAAYRLNSILSEAGGRNAKLSFRMDPDHMGIVISSGDPATASQLMETLKQPVKSMSFEGADFGHAIRVLRDSTDAPFIVEWELLKRAGITSATPIYFEAQNLTLSKTLELLLESVNTERTQLRFQVTEEFIIISPAQPGAKPLTEVKPKLIRPTFERTDKVLPELNFDDAKFGEAIDFMREISGANMFVDWKALEAVGVTRNTTLGIKVRDVKFQPALSRLLAAASDDPKKIAYQIEDGVIRISTAKKLAGSVLAATQPVNAGETPLRYPVDKP